MGAAAGRGAAAAEAGLATVERGALMRDAAVLRTGILVGVSPPSGFLAADALPGFKTDFVLDVAGFIMRKKYA